MRNAPVDSVEVFVRLVGQRLGFLVVDVFIVGSNHAEDRDTSAQHHLAALKFIQLTTQAALDSNSYLPPQVFQHPNRTRPILLRWCLFEEFPVRNQLFYHVLRILGRHDSFWKEKPIMKARRCKDHCNVHTDGVSSPMFIHKTQKQQLLDLIDLVCNFILWRKTTQECHTFLSTDWTKCHDRQQSLDFTETDVSWSQDWLQCKHWHIYLL